MCVAWGAGICDGTKDAKAGAAGRELGRHRSADGPPVRREVAKGAAGAGLHSFFRALSLPLPLPLPLVSKSGCPDAMDANRSKSASAGLYWTAAFMQVEYVPGSAGTASEQKATMVATALLGSGHWLNTTSQSPP